MRFIKIIILAILLSSMLNAASIKETIVVATVGGAICKNYAEEVDGDVEAFSDMNVAVMKLADKMGYIKDLNAYLSGVNKIKGVFEKQLLKKHGSKLNVYNDWCIKFYNSYQDGLAKTYR